VECDLKTLNPASLGKALAMDSYSENIVVKIVVKEIIVLMFTRKTCTADVGLRSGPQGRIRLIESRGRRMWI